MFKGLEYKALKQALALIAVCSSVISLNVLATDSQTFFNKLKEHYQPTQSIEKFSLNYHFYNKQYRSQSYWDFQSPDRVLSVRMVEIDTTKKHFYDNDVLYGPGGHILDRVQFQNDTHSYYYEKNGNYLGKRYFNEGMENFDQFMSYNIMNIDFLAVRPLLEETDIKGKISLSVNEQTGTKILTHKKSDKQIIDYEFAEKPLRLISLHNKSRQARYTYDDYHTTRGLTYARAVNKYYNGAKIPAYISFNDKFEIINEVDANRLQLPEGYGPEVPKSDGILKATAIAKDLYLVTDSSAWRNSLFKVQDNEIIVFGGAGNSNLAQKTIALITEKFPDKTISAIHVTHPHVRDIAGLAIYAERGVKILADEYTIEGIKAQNRFKDKIADFEFQTISNQQTVAGIQFYVLESLHAKRQSFAYFEKEGIIFQADFMRIAFDNTIPKVIPTYTKAFIDFIREEKLKFHRIVSNYQNNNISVEVVNKTYDAMM